MKRIAMVGFTVMLAVLALGTMQPAAGQGEGSPHPRMAGPGHGAERLLAMLEIPRVRQLLGLTDDQASRLRQITVDTEKAAIKTKADLAVRGIELRELLLADNPDGDTVMKKVQEISDLTTQLMKLHVQALLSAKTVLTPEQQKKIRELSANWRLGQEGMHPGHPGMQGGPGRPPMPPRPATQPPAHPMEPPVE
jgi:Spy/CpxP family protein refolding chaperone